MARSIEITTAHNIVVYFELATLIDRILAVVIDMIIIFFVSSFVIGFGGTMGLGTSSTILAFLFLTFYHLAFEVFNGGQSPGKRILGIKVVNLKGLPPDAREAFQRWIYRILDISFSLGALGSIFITSSPKNQRLGDQMAGCTVIKIKKNSDVSLDRIERIQEREREILYPKVRVYQEEDMLLVKETLQRHQKFKNRSTRLAIRKLSSMVASDLKIDDISSDAITFLEDVLKDYVSLTR